MWYKVSTAYALCVGLNRGSGTMGALDLTNRVVSFNSKLKEFTQNDVAKMINLLFGESPSLIATDEEFVEKIEKLLFGKSHQLGNSAFTEMVRQMEQYQLDAFEVVSPKFIYEGVTKASGWKWYLCHLNKQLRDLKKSLVRGTSRWQKTDKMINLLQDYIEAVNIVLDKYYDVDVDQRASQDPLDEVDFRVSSDPKYAEYQKLFVKVENILG